MPSVKIQSSNFPQLMEHLRRFWPDSLMVYSVVNSLHRGVLTGFNVYTDKWPDSEATVINADPEKCKNGMWKSLVFIFERNPSALISLLSGEDRIVLDTSRNLLFPGITKETIKHVIKSFPDKKFSCDCSCSEMYWIKDKDKLIIKSLPEGFRKGPMTKELAEDLAKNSQLVREGFADDVLQSTLKGYPNIVLCEQNSNKPVGWYMQSCSLGTLGNLFVVPELRSKGLGKYLTSALTEDVLERDGVAFMHVAQDNTISKKLHEDLGFEYCGAIAYTEMINA